MNKIARRTMLAAVPAMGMAPIVPALAEPLDAELFSLIEGWRTQYDVVNTDSTNYADVKDDLEFARLRDIEEAIVATRPITIEGFAAKMLVLLNFGEHDLDGPAVCILSDAIAISGLKPPATMKVEHTFLEGIA